MKGWITSLLLQLQFLTRIPIPGRISYDEQLLVRGFVFAPLIGLLTGLLTAGTGWLVSLLGQRVLTVAAVLTVEILVTGALHLDGFADTCDGLGSSRPVDRALEIMKDSRTGVFGVTGIVLLLLCKAALLYALPVAGFYSWLICMPVISRFNAVLMAGVSGYAGRERGLGAAYCEQTGPGRMIAAGVSCALFCLPLTGFRFPLPAMLTAVWTLWFCRRLKQRLGGITGDTIGYAIEMSEVLFLAAAVVQAALLTGLEF